MTEQELEGARQPVTEEPAWCLPGVPMLLLGIVLIIGGIAVAVGASHLTGAARAGLIVLTVIMEICGGAVLGGLVPVSPGHARVIQLFGRYCGTIRDAGLKWVNPLTKRIVLSTRIRNQESAQLKVNDADGNPIEIAAVVVWQVRDTAHATYSVDEVTKFVTIQMETAVRHIASSYPLSIMAERKGIQLRLHPAVHDALAGWASDDLRSTNAQIEFLLRRALAEAGRLPGHVRQMRRPGRPPRNTEDGTDAGSG